MPNTLAELLEDAADALESRDLERIEELMQVNDEWLQTEGERTATRRVLESMADAIEEIEDYESNVND